MAKISGMVNLHLRRTSPVAEDPTLLIPRSALQKFGAAMTSVYFKVLFIEYPQQNMKPSIGSIIPAAYEIFTLIIERRREEKEKRRERREEKRRSEKRRD
ncbi:hypothetical protein DUI87_06565 [Hirundo rustica rustica]|uniref:Uncharacterized protein n=1 Tax=Hirundo rustica rustica TaxID=333673 RepID=A0A3M0LBS0_HIRRU|nr:hypothetical protein DUI87_06565 [Hirundo rustica rustica]